MDGLAKCGTPGSKDANTDDRRYNPDMAVSALDLYLTGRRYKEAIETIATAPLVERGHLSTLILTSSALEVYLKASVAKAGQRADYPSNIPFYRQNFGKLYQDARSAGLGSVQGIDDLIDKANTFHQLFRHTDAGYVLAMSYVDVFDLPLPALDVLDRLDRAVEAHVRDEFG